MTKVATMGTSSCATIAINGFKHGQKEINEKYKKDGTVPNSEGLSVEAFYKDILYPVDQPLGCSRDLPFTKLMEDITAQKHLKTKFCIATLCPYQYMGEDKYWHRELKKWGFKLVRKTRNSTMSGAVNYVYIRNPNRDPIYPGDR